MRHIITEGLQKKRKKKKERERIVEGSEVYSPLSSGAGRERKREVSNFLFVQQTKARSCY